MKTRIVTLGGILFEGETKAVHVRTQSGDITILDHHQPLISLLAPESRVTVETRAGVRETFTAAGGLLHLDGTNQLTVLV